MNAANQRQLTPILAAVAAVFGAALLLLASGIGRHPHWSPPRAPPPLPPAASSDALPQPLPLPQFALVWQKPLFNPERKPVARAAAGGSSLGDLDLTGIILTPGLRLALLHDRNGDEQVRLHEGESLPDGSVTLVELHERSALFDSPSGRTELKLPSGAPIDQNPSGAAHTDQPAAGADAADGDAGPGPDRRSGDGNVIVAPVAPPESQPTPGDAAQSRVERLRQNIQKRRAAHAAARKGER